jgi:hypothetical protein
LWQISFTWNLAEVLSETTFAAKFVECFSFLLSDFFADELQQGMLLLDHPLALFVVTLLLLWLAAWIGVVLQARRHDLPESVREDYGTIVGATLTLLGLLIGFTFSMATTRYDLRKNLEEEEANAIGTEYARLDFLPAAEAGQLQGLLRQYTDLRIHFYITRDQAELRRLNADTSRLQNQMWALVAQAAQLQSSPLTALASSGMNDVLNAQGYTQAAWWNRIPIPAWCLMFIIALLSNLLLGYGMHRRAVVLSVVLPVAVSVSFFLISDIDSPRGGVIRIHPQNLYALADGFQSAPSTLHRVPSEPGAGEDH